MPKRKQPLSPLDQVKTLHKNLSFASSEAYKMLRANIQFILPRENEENCRVIGISSATYGEGKSTTSINLSFVLAESGKRVLLLDGDMRLPSIGKNLQMRNSPGLSNLLISSDRESKVLVRQTSILENWYVLPSGDIPPNPSELLGSKRMRAALAILEKEFDYIIIDLPPINMVSDAIVLSPMLDGMLLVVRENYTSQKEITACINQLALTDAKVLGVVMNCVRESYKRYGKYGRYKKYNYYYRKKDEDEE